MTQEERRIYLIKALLAEMPQYQGNDVPAGEDGQKQLLRALMNVRPPIPVESNFLEVQDAYLSAEVKKRGLIDGNLLSPVADKSRIYLWQGDITRLKVDAIVNAANSDLLGCFQPCHYCIDNIIHSFAGVQLRLKCNEIMQEQGYAESAGLAKMTPGYNLPCKFILHTVGPIISGPLRKKDCELLVSCYQSCMKLAAENGIGSIAFCCISTGVFNFPQEKAAEIAVETVSRFLEQDNSITQVIFDVFTNKNLVFYQHILER